MRVLVCGGRDYTHHQSLFDALDLIHQETPITRIIHGAARGADRLAGGWAEQNNVPCTTFPADWQNLGLRAGPMRNRQMLRYGQPDLVVAFSGGSGTEDMKHAAQAAGVKVIER